MAYLKTILQAEANCHLQGRYPEKRAVGGKRLCASERKVRFLMLPQSHVMPIRLNDLGPCALLPHLTLISYHP